jgi:hypothetical protein
LLCVLSMLSPPRIAKSSGVSWCKRLSVRWAALTMRQPKPPLAAYTRPMCFRWNRAKVRVSSPHRLRADSRRDAQSARCASDRWQEEEGRRRVYAPRVLNQETHANRHTLQRSALPPPLACSASAPRHRLGAALWAATGDPL